MNRSLFSLVIIGLLGVACVNPRTTAQEYKALGKHELASQYFALLYLGDRESPEAQSDFKASLDLMHRNLALDYDKALEAADHQAALGIAVQQDELARWEYSLRVPGSEPNRHVDQLERSRRAALKQAIKKVDDLEVQNATSQERLRSLREAMALAPDDSELSNRYERMRSKLKKHIRVRLNCAQSHQIDCLAAKSLLMQKLTQVNRELFVISTNDSELASFELVLSMNTARQTGRWVMERSGRLTTKLPKKNEFKEQVKNKKGKPVYFNAHANYSSYVMTNQGQVELRLGLQELKPPHKSLFTYSRGLRESDTKRYYTWNGDERAVKGNTNLSSLGTDQRMPLDAEALTRRAWQKLIRDASAKLVNVLEN